ncbi:MAG TPA: hypothetical protein VFS70_22525 [Actinomycetota bacterium]|nr:hypothetical protein [Actinomycetota bacterium]
MRTMAKAVVLLLVVAFVAGVWDARSGDDWSPEGSGPPFRTAPVERSHAARPAPELVSVATSERDGYDRVVFTFRGAAPGYQVRYVSRVTDQAGRKLDVDGQAFLAVVFEPARAHDRAGQASFATADLGPGAPALRQVRFAGDFEGQVSFGIGVADRGGFRVSELRDPARVAVDVR